MVGVASACRRSVTASRIALRDVSVDRGRASRDVEEGDRTTGGRDTDGEAANTDEADGGPVRIALSVPLPCGMAGCRRPTREALAEPDPTCPGAWVLLPICPVCDANVQAGVRVTAALSD